MREVDRPLWLWIAAAAALGLGVLAVIRLWPGG
jgi:hypothetical protein